MDVAVEEIFQHCIILAFTHSTLPDHQITSTNITGVKSAKYFKGIVIMKFSQILGCDKRAGINIGQVNDINASGFIISKSDKGSLVSRIKIFIHGGVLNFPSPFEYA